MSVVLYEVRTSIRTLTDYASGLEDIIALGHDNGDDTRELEYELELIRERIATWEHVREILEAEEAPAPEGIPGVNVQSA